MHRPLALAADPDQLRRKRIVDALAATPCAVRMTDTVSALPAAASDLKPDVVVVGCAAGEADGALAVIRRVRTADQRLPIVLVTSDCDPSIVIGALRAGVKDFFHEPLDAAGLARSIDRILARRVSREPDAIPKNAESAQPFVGDSASMRHITDYLNRLAQNDATVLITGETGTGKELAASWIHERSSRRRGRFVSVNCAAIPDGLLESELFGYESGAFTGAGRAREGLLQIANGGTVFLDEVGDMGPQGQAKILRAIETREIIRLGGKRPERLDVRIVAATNQDLETAVEQGRFRKDLYFRLNVARIHLPPLRERASDVSLLLDHYVRAFNRRQPAKVQGFAPKAVEALKAYDWPGNVRELKNLIEALFVSPPPRHVHVDDLPDDFRRRLRRVSSLPDAERRRLLEALLATKWNKSRAAEMLHWSRMTVYRKMAKYSVDPRKS